MEKLAPYFASNTEAQAISQVERELETIFGNSGKQVVVKEFCSRYDVSIADAIRRPSAFQIALYHLLGEMGSSLVMERINKRLVTVTPTAP